MELGCSVAVGTNDVAVGGLGTMLTVLVPAAEGASTLTRAASTGVAVNRPPVSRAASNGVVGTPGDARLAVLAALTARDLAPTEINATTRATPSPAAISGRQSGRKGAPHAEHSNKRRGTHWPQARQRQLPRPCLAWSTSPHWEQMRRSPRIGAPQRLHLTATLSRDGFAHPWISQKSEYSQIRSQLPSTRSGRPCLQHARGLPFRVQLYGHAGAIPARQRSAAHRRGLAGAAD